MIAPLKKKAVKNRVYKVSDFRKIFKSASDLIVEKDSVYSGYGFINKSPYLANYIVKQIFVSCDRTFFYCENFTLYESKDNKFNPIYNFSCDHIHVGELMQNANKKVFIAGEFGAKFLGNVIVKNFPITKNMVINNEQIYTENDGKISFYTPYDYVNQHADLTETNSILVLQKKEEVLGMFYKDNSLFLICKNSIYFLALDSELYNCKVNRLDINNLDILDKSLAIGNECCTFISGESLFLFDGGLKRVDTPILSNFTFTAFNNAFNYNSTYFLPIKDENNVNFCYFYNLSNGKQGFLSNVTCASENGLFVENKYIKQIDFNSKSTNKKVFITKDIDFSSSEVKTLNSLEVEVAENTTLQIEGDFGIKKYTLKGGYNKLYLNKQSNYFRFKFTCNGEFNMQNLNLYYRYKGE